MLTAGLILLSLTGAPEAVHLDYSVTVHLRADGTITENTSTAVIPLNGRGVQRYSTLSLTFREGMEEIHILEARVGHWRGGRGSSQADLSTGPHSILAGTNRLESSLRETLVIMPGVEVGDTVYLSMEREIHELPLSNVYSYTFSPEMRDSVASASFTVINDSEEQLFSSDPRSSFIFPAASALSDHPLAAEESHSVSIATGTPAELSADASLELDDPRDGNCPELDRILAENGTSPGVLREWVAENISYIGAEAGIWPGWSPRSPSETLADRSGVCRDRAILLMWLLRKAGYEAYPALVTTSDPAPAVLDSRAFDHMITVYRDGTSSDWELLDPTPRGLPEQQGISFGLRGASFLPVTPEGSGLQRIPTRGWNDTLKITIRGELSGQILSGTLHAAASGAPLELLTTLYTRSDPALLEEMFRRFFGASSCLSVSMDDGEVSMEGSWKVPGASGMYLLPGLRDVSLPGTRLAAMLLPAVPDSFVLDAPVVELLTVSLPWNRPGTILPQGIDTGEYSCAARLSGDSLILSERADLSDSAENPPETLFLRSGTPARTVVVR